MRRGGCYHQGQVVKGNCVLIGVISDSHDNVPKLRATVEVFRKRGVQHIVHAGDYVAPFSVKVLVGCGIPFTGVFGNNDGERAGIGRLTKEIHSEPYQVGLGGRRITLVHHLTKLPPEERTNADVIVFGHTHVPHVEQGPPLLVNPGECCGWVEGKCTVALLDTEALRATILEV
ncbi:MAG: metallophosphoesterase [Planctomycetes bacterium]|nr:metallophosphoesterase [Planctomycetota bacterium]